MTSTNKTSSELADERLEKAMNGTITITWAGQPFPCKLTSQEKQEFEQTKEQGYVVVGKRENLRNVFNEWCSLHQRPYIAIEKHGKHAHVVMDLVFCQDRTPFDEPLFREKLLTVITAVGNAGSEYGAGGVYNDVSSVPIEQAEYVARSFYAIYQQCQGLAVKAPAFPATDAVLFSHMVEAKEMKYAVCANKRRWLIWRWKEFCNAYHWPTIMIDEKRKGIAKVDVSLPKGVTFHPDVRQAIIRAAQESGLKAETARANVTDKLFLCYDTHTYMTHPIPAIDAIRFAEWIVTILEKAGYFPEIDESWHE